MKKIWYAPYKFESYGEEEIKAVEKSLRSGWLGGQGPKSVEFEEKIAKRFGKKYGILLQLVKDNFIYDSSHKNIMIEGICHYQNNNQVIEI